MAATIYFIVDENFTFYFMTKNFSRKFKNLENKQEVALVIGTENEPVTAQVQGIAEKITDVNEFNKIFDQLRKSIFENEYVAPLFQLSPQNNDIVLFKITPTWIRWLDLRGEKKNSEFVQIL